MRHVLRTIPQEEVLALLPESSQSLQALTTLGQQGMADHLAIWQQAKAARLKHLTFQLTPVQLEVVEEVLKQMLPTAKHAQNEGPNVRGTALYLVCKSHLENQRSNS